MRNRLTILIILLELLCLTKIYSQQITIENLSIKDGLSQNVVTCMYQDLYGLLWFGTQDGLNFFDGYEFKRFRHDPTDSVSISGNYINSITQDFNGNYWIATQNGLNKLETKTGNFTLYQNNLANPNSVSSNLIYYVYTDRNGKIWCLSASSLSLYNPTDDNFSNYRFYRDSTTYVSNYNNFCIIEDAYNLLWIATKDGLNLFDRMSKKFIRYTNQTNIITSLSNNQIRCIYEDKLRNLWIGTENGLNLFDRRKNNFRRFYYNADTSFINENIIRQIYMDSNGRIWIASEAGVKRLNSITGKIEDAGNISKTINSRISSLFADKSEILWIGTWTGIYKINFSRKKFNIIRKNESGIPDLTDNFISSVFQDFDGMLWIGSKISGLNIYDQKTGKVTQVKKNTSPYKIPDNQINCIFSDCDSNIWIGTNNGISIYYRKTKTFVEFEKISKTKNISFLRNNRISSITQDKAKRIWIGTYNGLMVWDNISSKIYQHNSFDKNSLSSNEIYKIFIDSDRNIWIGTLYGLNQYLPDIDGFKVFIRDKKHQNSLSNNSVLSIAEDKNNVLWFGTESGLTCFDKKTDSFRFFTQKNGFINDYIYGVLSDNSSNIWVSTNHGIARLDSKTEIVTNFDLEDGLQGYEYNLGAYYKSPNNVFWFGGSNGINYFQPDSLIINKYAPDVIVTSIEINTKDGKIEKKIFLHNEIEIDFRTSLTVSFTIPEYTNPKKNIFKYQIPELSDEWIFIQHRNFINFSQFQPGEYTIKIIGGNSDNIWCANPLIFKLKVNPPFYRTKLAYGFYIIAGILFIYLGIMLITNNMRKENIILLEKQKAALQIARQREELATKNQNITDSLHYAKRIIHAMLPTDSYFSQLLPESFVVFMPKDIVSGDFFWIEQQQDKIFLAVADCTGHGVPGAFMSIIGLDLLRDIIKMGIDDSAVIMNKLNELIANKFRKEDGIDFVKDGMDLAFCVIDKKNQKICYSGAFNPLFLIRDNKLIEYPGDRFSVGIISQAQNLQFKSHIIELESNDIIYLFTDGYADQFGGPENKKFKYRRFKHLLLNIHNQSCENQKKAMIQTFRLWKENYDQIDDILIVGFKPLA